MKMLFTSPEGPEVGLVKGLLDEAGIPCEVRNENSYANFAEGAFMPELWVLDEADFPKAAELRDAWCRQHQRVVHIRTQNTLLAEEWDDELHPTTRGVQKIAARFQEALVRTLPALNLPEPPAALREELPSEAGTGLPRS